MTAWLTEEQLQEEFESYLKGEYGDNDGDLHIENVYISIVTIVQDTGNYDEMFEAWKENELANDGLFEHPVQSRWTRNEGLFDYAESHPNNDDVTDWDSIDEAPDDPEFEEGDDVYVDKPGDQWHGMVVTILEVDESDDTYRVLPKDEESEDDSQWYDFDQVTEENPNAGQPMPAPAAPAVPTDTGSEYPTQSDPLPLDANRLPFKVGDPVISVDHPNVGTDTSGTIHSLDLSDKAYTYYVLWSGGTSNYAMRKHLLPDPAAEERAATEKARILAEKLERARDFLDARKDHSDEHWKTYIERCASAFAEYGVTREMVQTIADALRPPKSHAATITL